MTFPALHLVPLGACLAAGTVWDLAKRRVPDAVSLTTALAGVVVQGMDRGVGGALSGVAAGVLTVVLLYRPWVAGGIGGGDVKLAAGAAIWVGLGNMIRYSLVVAASGGVVAFVAYLLSGQEARREIKNNLVVAAFEQKLPAAPAPTPGRVSVPYAVAVSAGALITFLTT